MENEVWFRAETRRYSQYDPEWDFYRVGSPQIEFTEYRAVRHTPKGVWLSFYGSEPFFVLGTAKKQTAVPTKELALRDLIARKRVHESVTRSRLGRIEAERELAERTLKGDLL